MGEPSQEAREEARAHMRELEKHQVFGYPQVEYAVAELLQRHMDATEETRTALQEVIQYEFDRAEKAEARLAELVRDVREWERGNRIQWADIAALRAILAKYEAES